MVETVIFAMIAAFLGLRLYAVLGKRTGHEHGVGQPADAPAPRAATLSPERDEESASLRPDWTTPAPYDEAAMAGLKSIAAASRNFNSTEFLEGSKAAYQMILEAFWKGEAAALDGFVAGDVAEEFKAAIADRIVAGHTLDNRLIRIDRALIVEAVLDGKIARITVQFDADIAAVTRDADGQVIAGSLTDGIQTHDVWTFERDVRSNDPNWVLADTDEA